MRVIEDLRADISSLEFGPGVRLIERDLCERYSVSRTVIREALRHLEAEGLVKVIPNHGPVVSQLSLQEGVEIYELRGVLEPLLCTLFMNRASDDQKRNLLTITESYEVGLMNGDVQAWDGPDKYYDQLMEGCGNELLANIFRASQTRIRLTRQLSLGNPGRALRSAQEFRKIAIAITQDDLDGVRRAVDTHVNNASRFILEALQRRRPTSELTTR
ncbi:MAG: transcriptional regulator, GntR family [Subtercola sp.]|nr:transcriptional regulator, GntR family [Subtercola sp.]